MDNLIFLAGALAAIRSYWVYNLIRQERGVLKANLKMFLNDKNKFLIYILVRPFYMKMQDESLKRKVNIITYAVYVSFIVGMIYVLKM